MASRNFVLSNIWKANLFFKLKFLHAQALLNIFQNKKPDERARAYQLQLEIIGHPKLNSKNLSLRI
jgi:hypothetical protein